VSLGGVIVCYLGLLASPVGIALLVGFGGLPVRLGGFVVVRRCFVVVMF